MLMKTCNRCGKLIPYGKRYCEACEPIMLVQQEEMIREAKQRSNRRYNQRRDPKYTRFYNSKKWRILSKKRLIFDGFRCVKCGQIASEVDHIKPIQTDEGWELRYNFDNLQSLCLKCHNKKHGRF